MGSLSLEGWKQMLDDHLTIMILWTWRIMRRHLLSMGKKSLGYVMEVVANFLHCAWGGTRWSSRSFRTLWLYGPNMTVAYIWLLPNKPPSYCCASGFYSSLDIKHVFTGRASVPWYDFDNIFFNIWLGLKIKVGMVVLERAHLHIMRSLFHDTWTWLTISIECG